MVLFPGCLWCRVQRQTVSYGFISRMSVVQRSETNCILWFYFQDVCGAAFRDKLYLMVLFPGCLWCRVQRQTVSYGFISRMSVVQSSETNCILWFYFQDVCGAEFRDELLFWRLNPDLLEECCWVRYQRAARGDNTIPGSTHVIPGYEGSSTMWKILENSHPSVASKVLLLKLYSNKDSVRIRINNIKL